VAVLSIEKLGLTLANVRNVAEAPIRLGDDAIAIGNPLGSLGGTVTKGIIGATARELNMDGTIMTLLQTDASINPGNSGGGLFDINGLLIGIVNAKATGSDVEGLGFAIPIETAIDIADDLMSTANDPNNQYGGLGYVPGKFMLGITTSGEAFNVNGYTYGYVVAGTDLYGSLAGKITVNDIIVKLDDTALSSTVTIRTILNGKHIGDSIKVTILKYQSLGWGRGTYNESSFTATIRQYVYGYVPQ
jgi:Trypsin-like serine proteases, typically periplasmic, contain C-terminal PDZ domain